MADPPFFPSPVGIVGARGRMGRWLAGWLQGRGCSVLGVDQAEGSWEPAFAGRCRLLLLSVPAPEVEPVMAALGPHTRPDGLVMDITSLKEAPLASMLAHARGEVLGLHPLFGPAAPSWQGQTVFLCPGRGKRWPAQVRAVLTREGARLHEISPQRHDRLMASVQTLRHLLLAAWGAALAELGFDPSQEKELAGPWSNQLLDLLQKQCAQPGELYASTALANPHAARAAATLSRLLGEASGALGQGDQKGLRALFKAAEAFSSRQSDKLVLDRMKNVR